MDDPRREVDRLVEGLRDVVLRRFRRRGAVLGVSGGLDSAVVLALCARAFGPERVIAAVLPDRESDPASERLASEAAACLGVKVERRDLTPALEALGCYRERDAAIREVDPAYDPAAGDRAKLVLTGDPLKREALNAHVVVVEARDGERRERVLGGRVFQRLYAAANLKQRLRAVALYELAERHHHAVVGTANKDEHDLGFFVKHGDGACDVRPIVHLHKVEVRALAEALDVPPEILRRRPTTDTWSADCSQEEAFFRVPFETLAVLSRALDRGAPPAEVAAATGLSEEAVRRALEDLARKRATTDYLRASPVELK